MDFFENDTVQRLEKELEDRKSNYLWVEKYRPLTLDNFIGNTELKSKFNNYIKENDLCHLLLHGKPGTGKTSAAFILAKTINCDYLYLNASSENSVDTVRNKIINFAMSAGFKGLKIIILDEADYLSASAMASLRAVMEQYSAHTRFILTCNHVERIIEPIISRCQTINLTPPSKKDVAIHVSNVILRNENVKANPLDLKFVIDSQYPDIRRIVNTIQMQTSDGVFSPNKKEMVDSDYKLKILEILKDQKIDKKNAFKDIRQIFADNSISDFSDVYRLLYDNLDEFAKGHLAQVILILADGQYKDAFAVDKEINCCATIIQILNEVKE